MKDKEYIIHQQEKEKSIWKNEGILLQKLHIKFLKTEVHAWKKYVISKKHTLLFKHPTMC